eukprot:CAMPEP_0113523076 /NCGR_PEP_ID=MMETSP0014_2-20120614/45521_1 /TAXON_ID=2857 /ORGANISM="Nitzschia sp." /LENGTH=653 /DNA_ID=CAMNT_0000421159 /DNA_START=9 /DNA_END=1966 /DNA_ORIENTATION=+ /assembly_acc=CAM_ASM_000159
MAREEKEDRKKDDREDDREDDERTKRKRDRRRDEHGSKSKGSGSDSDNSDDESDEKRRKRRRREQDRRRRKSKSSRKKKKSKEKKKRRSRDRKRKHKKKSRDSDSDSSSSSSSSSDGESSASSSSSDGSDDSSREGNRKASSTKKVINQKLLAKLNARGETLEERKERRAQKRAAKIEASFGYTAEENPFNDPNLAETFTWGKKNEKVAAEGKPVQKQGDAIDEIENIRKRRKERELEREEMDRLRAEESRMKELENYDEWAKKEEEFHLEQQRKRSAIRLVEGREKPVDVLAKNLLLFGLTEEEKQNRAAVNYQERYNVMNELQNLDAELEEPHDIVRVLKLEELQDLATDIGAFRMLEREAGDGGNATILMYWDALAVVVKDEIFLLQNGGEGGPYAKKVESIKSLFEGQSRSDLLKMKEEIQNKLTRAANANYASDGFDRPYWLSVMEQLNVKLAKVDLSELHSKMLVRQLEKLEQRKADLAEKQKAAAAKGDPSDTQNDGEGVAAGQSTVPKNVSADFGNLDEELGLTDEVALSTGGKSYAWQERYAPRKPRYFNRVRTGFDWNKYNQTHYDSDNPPPKIVLGYKFNIFYPDLVDPTKTPQYFLEPADSDEFCILRFHAGPPYEDIAFKIMNREWNRSRKRGFRSTFER